MKIKFLMDLPALLIPDKKILVIADLHIGLEHELYKNGIVIHPQAEKFRKTIDQLIEATGARTLVVVGDVKHKVPGITYREEKEIPKLFSYLIRKVEVIVVKGNHDTYLQEILPKEVKVYPSEGFRIGKYGFFHGHAWPSKDLMGCDYLFMAHIHPVIEFSDDFGYRNIEQVWVKGRLNDDLVKKKYGIDKTGQLDLIVLPTFNRLLGGVALNRVFRRNLIGPILVNKILDLKNSKAYLLDGTFLGDIKHLTK